MSGGGAHLKFSRDRRGYENFCLVQPSLRGGRSRTRILYWFRSPPNVKVGRAPFDEDMQRLIEAQNPDIAFDWKRLLAIAIPPPDEERWREWRRANRAAKTSAAVEPDVTPESERLEAELGAIDDLGTDAGAAGQNDAGASDGADASSAAGGAAAAVDGIPRQSQRRRRRRGGRRNRHIAAAGNPPASEPAAPAGSTAMPAAADVPPSPESEGA